jgi:dolichol-phosphate mannosyltransferase
MMPPVELAVVIPTYNERPNVEPLIGAMERALAGVSWEAVFVDDDSSDDTFEEVRRIAVADSRIRCIRRVGRRGLSSAVVEGILATSARYVAVMDADLQHDEAILPAMLEKLRNGGLDVVVASRYLQPGGTGEFAADRVRLSALAARLSRMVIRQQQLTDPMSGFFMLRRSFFEEVVYDISGVGFKILLDIIASAKRKVRIGEVPYVFRKRQYGESKLDISVGVEYLYLLLDKLFGRFIPVRFAIFAAVGGVGVGLHLLILWLLYFHAKTEFATAQITGTYAAMTLNFVLNNIVTFRERRLRGKYLVVGFFSFLVACTIGAVTNVSLAVMLAGRGVPVVMAAVAGLVISSVWNYTFNEVFTWRWSAVRARRRRAAVSVEDHAAQSGTP